MPERPHLERVTADPGVSVSHACRELAVGERRLRQLITDGLLMVLGDGHGKRIASDSLQRELDRRKRNPEIEPEISGNRGDSFPNFCGDGLPMRNEGVQDESVLIRFPHMKTEGLNSLTLLGIPQAASLIGLHEDRMRQLVNNGAIESVPVGQRRRVSVEALQRFARGEKIGGAK